MFTPDPALIASCDARWRKRLGDSFAYIGDVLDQRGEDARPAMAALKSRLAEGPVSPWVSGLYSKLVAEIGRNGEASIRPLIEALEAAAALPPRSATPLALGEPSIPEGWWEQFLRLMDTDRELPFRPIPPSVEDAAAARAEIAAAMALLARVDPAFHDETAALAGVIVLGAPSDDQPVNDFGACSSFFMREAILLNAAKRRSAMRMLDALIHEASHVLLFGLATEQPLTADRGEVRLKSAARSDPRPVDGIFHACFVSTRVHSAMSRMIATGLLTPAEAREAAQRRDRNGDVAVQTLETLERHAATTALGADVLGRLKSYWGREGAAAA